jgi:hypothetical protein
MHRKTAAPWQTLSLLLLLFASWLTQRPAAALVPSAPSGLTARALNTSQIAVDWRDMSSGENRFELQRRAWFEDSWTHNLVGKSLAANSSHYVDSVEAGVTYYYRVRACTGTACSAWSNEDFESTAFVDAAVLPVANAFVMPFGQPAPYPHSVNELNVSTCPNPPNRWQYPRNHVGDATPPIPVPAPTGDKWYVATAYNWNRWVSSDCVDQGLYTDASGSAVHHPGDDWDSTKGSGFSPNGDRRAPLYSISSGVVIFAGHECRKDAADAGSCDNFATTDKKGVGNTVIILHKLATGELVQAVYWHMADPPLLIEGAHVDPGTQIGYIGSTGTSAYHLHFEIRRGTMSVVHPITGRVALTYAPNTWPPSLNRIDEGSSFIAANYYSPTGFLAAQRAPVTLQLNGQSVVGMRYTPGGGVRRFIQRAGQPTERIGNITADTSGRVSWFGCVFHGTATIFAIDERTWLIGDLNGDGIVNSLDFSILNTKWLTKDALADLNGDGIVNSLDWSILNGNWFKTAPALGISNSLTFPCQ